MRVAVEGDGAGRERGHGRDEAEHGAGQAAVDVGVPVERARASPPSRRRRCRRARPATSAPAAISDVSRDRRARRTTLGPSASAAMTSARLVSDLLPGSETVTSTGPCARGRRPRVGVRRRHPAQPNAATRGGVSSPGRRSAARRPSPATVAVADLHVQRVPHARVRAVDDREPDLPVPRAVGRAGEDADLLAVLGDRGAVLRQLVGLEAQRDEAVRRLVGHGAQGVLAGETESEVRAAPACRGPRRTACARAARSRSRR